MPRGRPCIRDKARQAHTTIVSLFQFAFAPLPYVLLSSPVRQFGYPSFLFSCCKALSVLISFEPPFGHRDCVMEFLLQQTTWRQVGHIGGYPYTAFAQLEKLHVLVRFV